MEEIWKDICGYEGIYQVSNLGNVKSIHYRGTNEARNLTPKKNCRGYLWVEMKSGSKHRCALVHRLVAETFIANPNGLPFINHKDEIKTNNAVENLEWCTASYNVRYSMNLHPDRSRAYEKRKSKAGVPYKHRGEIVQYSKAGNKINTYPNVITVCNENNWRGSSIIECCNGKRKTAYGYIWRYAG